MKQISEKLYSWASIVNEETLEQARLTATMPFVDPHVALMPDAHQGIGATVGSVIPTVGAVMPAAVGVDIGCGMVAVRTQFTEERLRRVRRPLAELREQIERVVPVSAGQHNTKVWGTAAAAVERLEELAAEGDEEGPVRPAAFAKNWRRQLGSLGSGNHFAEVSADEQGHVWVFLHSGSRGVGNRIASHFIDKAKQRTTRRSAALPHRDLAYLTDDDPAFRDYLTHLHWAQEFARLNREVMKDRILDELSRFMGEDAERVQEVNAHHNYTAREVHFGREVLVSRKGAIDAHEGVAGLIPGSMGTASYVVTGKGNAMALHSAPHGAGRLYSRTRARKTFTQDDLRARMIGIEYRDLPDFVDEIPDAYKDIDVIMADAAELVSVDHVLRQIVNVKGQ